MKYTWQNPNWPQFTYDQSQCQHELYQYALEAGRLAGGMGQLKKALQYEAYIDLMVSEAIHTSQIEGEVIDREDVRSSIKNMLGLTTPPARITDPRAEGIAALMIDVRKTFSKPLTEEKLFHWHQLVMENQDDSLLHHKIQVGMWRTSEDPMQIVSGPIGYEKVHYEAPPAQQVKNEMGKFLTWYNDTSPLNPERTEDVPGPIRSAISHLWFETIHPFDDGNGRVGRAIAEQALAQDLNRPHLLSLSSIIKKDKKSYYAGISQASHGSLDVTKWVNWFAGSVLDAQNEAIRKIDFVLKKSNFWDTHQNNGLNERQIKVIKRIFKAGIDGFENGIGAKKYTAISGCSKATATRDLADLLNKGCINKLEGAGRNVRYSLKLENRDLVLGLKESPNTSTVEGVGDRASSWRQRNAIEEINNKGMKPK